MIQVFRDDACSCRVSNRYLPRVAVSQSIVCLLISLHERVVTYDEA